MCAACFPLYSGHHRCCATGLGLLLNTVREFLFCMRKERAWPGGADAAGAAGAVQVVRGGRRAPQAVHVADRWQVQPARGRRRGQQEARARVPECMQCLRTCQSRVRLGFGVKQSARGCGRGQQEARARVPEHVQRLRARQTSIRLGYGVVQSARGRRRGQLSSRARPGTRAAPPRARLGSR